MISAVRLCRAATQIIPSAGGPPDEISIGALPATTGRIIPTVEILWMAISAHLSQSLDLTRNNLEIGITWIIPCAE